MNISNFVPMSFTDTVKFGNSFDTGGYEICEAQILGKHVVGIVETYLVKYENYFGSAILREKDGVPYYHCTSRLPVTELCPKEFIAKHYGAPMEALV